ncbi:small oligopeptide transporter [Lentinus tigrinus ALCF2SS1-7]|uniref:Small oligopeptide transporter n=1 Tax=Lentinus tigrinus ALCF2SS1-6 TaxID=1328759 RepID=A0A5C2SPY3_9APHY|nr:small oligopeptide transporter [Lentinus tigrinus ALCF2SS1-6]RPD79436.1 small oligopeptide transporter [Lentinus tigrinus ALCF2SS1-7]
MSAAVEEDHRPETSSIVSSHFSVYEREKSIRSPRFVDAESLASRQSPAPDFFDPNYDTEITWLEDDSPYPEVRSAVANYDDPSMPVSTIRAWTLGILWAILLPGINEFYYFRYPSIMVTGIVAQLISFPMGRAWARWMPSVRILGVSLNPGVFTIKEHVLITIMAGVGAQAAYATEIIAVQRVWYDQNFNFAYQWMLVMSTQLIGFSVGGLARRLLVAPASMIWPNTLVVCALFNTLHSQSYAGIGNHKGLTRERFFAYAFVITATWYVVPGYLFQALSVFTWACWIAPHNVKVNALFGYHSGMGFSLLSFDWNQIAFIGSPLSTPWWAEANVIVGFLMFYWFLAPLIYFTNVWYAQYMPISALGPFDNTGKPYNLTRILNPDSTFNLQAYKEYSPLFLSSTFAISYGLGFASITATIVHAILYFRKPISVHLHRSLGEQPDIHARLMSQYPQVPEWWYAGILVVTFVFACLCIELFPTQMTIWALVVALLIACVYLVPIGMIQAITNRQVGLNVITELIVGYMLPGRPIAMMMFKASRQTWGYITMSQAMIFTSDFKLGHYMKIPPRPMFWCQIVATIIAGTVQLGVENWMFSNIPNICTQLQKDMSGFTCPNTEVFATASIIFGVVGPTLQFSKGQLYYLMFTGIGLIPPASAVNYVPWAIIGFLSQYVIRRRHFPFWAKYNYVLSAALDAGTAVATVLVYFILQYPQNGMIGHNTIQQWWGNNVFKYTADWHGTPLRVLPEGEHFGCVLLSAAAFGLS